MKIKLTSGPLLFIISTLLTLGGTWHRSAQPTNNRRANRKGDWRLRLVNRWHAIPQDYMVELVQLAGGESVDARIYPALQQMLEAARATGHHTVVRSGYRTKATQQQIMKEKIEAYRSEGHSAEESRELAEAWVALPDHSEHQLGIAVDINADKIRSTNREVYEWLAQNCSSYGFILRYPRDKMHLTGTRYEPWHFRYVGREAAQEMERLGVCLEEYMGG
ncbi:M15 family metallopeptidase [Paenibacillus daejeonensis]|uniref:M15 family metallopeptidase n=1 Tax=Paenibacillus daejeonensis TaxID=135193 RepID=UPI000376F6AB|nr:M15 family metallopeptidase [Paenibacillus daejeonensis]